VIIDAGDINTNQHIVDDKRHIDTQRGEAHLVLLPALSPDASELAGTGVVEHLAVLVSRQVLFRRRGEQPVCRGCNFGRGGG